MNAIVESFLKFSPRVQFRAPDLLFLDIASTHHLFQGEAKLMESAQSLARDLGYDSRAAIADSPAAAQAFAFFHGARLSFISPAGDEREHLKDLPLTALTQLEGLEAWSKPTHIESVISFFMMLGMHSLRDLSRFTLPSFQERWGETGAIIWKRLNGSLSERAEQVISPLHPTEALEDYMHLDFPVSLLSLLLHELERSLEFLFVRLQGRRLLARKVSLRLRCEYSKTQHIIEIEPQKPSRDQEMFLTLLENKLGKLDLSNPIRDFDFAILPTAEQVQQFDFFEPRMEENSKLDTLLNLLAQTRESTQLQAGFYKIHASTRPEDSWQLCTGVMHGLDRTGTFRIKADDDDNNKNSDDHCVSPADLGGFATRLPQAPRPTRLLTQPQALSLPELQNLKILSRNPIERLEDGWWEERSVQGSTQVPIHGSGHGSGHEAGHGSMQRDYYFAVSPLGQCLWIFQNRKTDEYFLHGYFD